MTCPPSSLTSTAGCSPTLMLSPVQVRPRPPALRQPNTRAGITPGYEQLEIDHDLLSGGLVTVASGMDKQKEATAIRIRNRHAAFHAAQLRPGQYVILPEAPCLHLFITLGSVDLEGTGSLNQGDAVRFTAAGGHQVGAAEPAENLVWEMRAGVAV
ncbi:hypothetical protein ABZV51_27775 [Streptomyces avermitilis]